MIQLLSFIFPLIEFRAGADDCSWSRWGSWSTCSVTCFDVRTKVLGTRSRARNCPCGSCSGNATQVTNKCWGDELCDCTSVWAKWGAWSFDTNGPNCKKERLRKCDIKEFNCVLPNCDETGRLNDTQSEEIDCNVRKWWSLSILNWFCMQHFE